MPDHAATSALRELRRAHVRSRRRGELPPASSIKRGDRGWVPLPGRIMSAVVPAAMRIVARRVPSASIDR
jgi:hypothetical protein